MTKSKRDLSNFSLQLLSMPDFMRSLRIGGINAGSRTSFVGHVERYGTQTLMGNWQERRVTTEPIKLPIGSTYGDDFRPLDHDQARDLKIGCFNACDDQWAVNQGMPYEDLMRQGPPHEYQKNKSTLYDLTYGRVCPELSRTQKAAVVKKITGHKPENDYALDYGNLTEYGLRRYKIDEWAKEEQTLVRLRTSTMYKDDYVEHPLEKSVKLKSPLKICSSSFNKILLDNQYFLPRGIPFRFVSEDCSYEIKPRKLISIVPELD